MIKVFATDDVALIRSIMMHEDILPTITDDTWSGEVYQPKFSDGFYLACVANPSTPDQKLVGLYYLHWITGVTLQGHAHILKEFRKEWSVKSLHAVMRYLIDNVRRCEKVACDVPLVYKNVIRFLEACGFTHEGLRRSAFKLNGNLIDMALLGATRQEMIEELGRCQEFSAAARQEHHAKT